MLQLHQRLTRCRDIGGLTLADLAVWLETPRATVKGWLLGLHYPTPSLRGAVLKKLEEIEDAIFMAGGPIIPTSVRHRDRAKYLRGLLDERKCKVHSADHS